MDESTTLDSLYTLLHFPLLCNFSPKIYSCLYSYLHVTVTAGSSLKGVERYCTTLLFNTNCVFIACIAYLRLGIAMLYLFFSGDNPVQVHLVIWQGHSSHVDDIL